MTHTPMCVNKSALQKQIYVFRLVARRKLYAKKSMKLTNEPTQYRIRLRMFPS